jgi:hypothetical protein
MVDRAHAA